MSKLKSWTLNEEKTHKSDASIMWRWKKGCIEIGRAYHESETLGIKLGRLKIKWPFSKILN